MAAAKPIKRDPFKRGDTASFVYVFTPPYVGFNWGTVSLDCAFTVQTAPTDNSGAAATRLNQTLAVDATNTASYTFQLTHTESLTLLPGSTYMDECQLKEAGGAFFTTAVTGLTVIAQDYII